MEKMHTMVKKMRRKYTLGLYEKAIPNALSIEEKLKLAYEQGFDFLELSIDETDEKLERLDYPESYWKAIKDVSLKTVPIHSMCLSGHRKYPLGSMNAQTRKKSLRIMKKAIDLAYFLGVRHIQLAGYDVYYEESNEKTKAYFLKGLKQSVSYASKKCIMLGFETMETSFMDTVEKAMVYVRKLKSPYLNVYPDIGNLTNAYLKYSDMTRDLAFGRGHVIAAHLKETLPGIYRNLAYGDGHTDYQSFLKILKKQGVSCFVGEFWDLGSADYLDKIHTSATFLREHLDRIFNL